MQEEFIARGVGAKPDERAASAARNSEAVAAPAELASKAVSNLSIVECRVCSQQTEAPVLFLPCSHRVACANCASRMKKCLECRAPIDEKVLEEPRIIVLSLLNFWLVSSQL